MVKTLLVRGMLAGLCAGLLAVAFAQIFGEPQIGRAIAFETARAKPASKAADPVLVSRTIQRTLGLTIGVCVYGVGFGGLFALAFAAIYGRVGRASPRATAALLALAGYLVIIAVPFLKYPANPPSIGNAATVTQRTELYFLMIVISILAAIASVRLYRTAVKRRDTWTAAVLAALAFIVTVGVAQLALPSVNEVPRAFSPTLLWRFRIASLGTQLVLWTSLGLGFGALAQRVMLRTAVTRRHTSPATAPPRP